MKADFWVERWEQNQLGWHQEQANDRLVREWPALGIDPGTPVFVPLCGKSLDMRWLRESGHEIVGVELSSIACRDFFAEADLPVTPKRTASFERYEAGGYTLLCGDLFALEAADLAGVGAVFDRGSLVALPPEMRARYAAHLIAVLPETVRILLVAVEYDQSQMNGPPHSVPDEEIEALFGRAFGVQRLYASEFGPAPPRFAERGLGDWRETVWLLERSPGGAVGRSGDR